ncbi:DUF4145 domain-containing protein [Empedobacter sp. UBA7248]|uniref:DUF4145 domain-containing protein n=1 Tax=Empedobacter sp. UBA7248 TaxID=1946448 RepID=UPI0025C09A2F|nr:DUF4145 domain-containing protein [Empedobacter sp. UBA7248]
MNNNSKKLFCRNCKGDRNHTYLHKVIKNGNSEDGYFQWSNKYFITQCEGCETISFLHLYGDSEMHYENDYNEIEYFEDEFIYPPYLKNGSEISYKRYLPNKIKEIYIETINAFKVNALILTAGGLRATIEAICNFLKIKKGSLEERIDLLNQKGHLTISESKRLHSIRFLGNDALHEIETPKKEHLQILLDIINHLLTNLFINDKILKDKIETVIDEYDDFIKLIQNKIEKEMTNKELKLNNILGKSKRVIQKNKLAELEKKLIENINNGSVDFLIYNEDTSSYKITKLPSNYFNFIS